MKGKLFMKKEGFTLVEILVAIIVMTLLVTMAVPMYQKAIEKSHMAEARAVLKQLFDAKQRALDEIGKAHFVNGTTNAFDFTRLDTNMACRNGGGGENQLFCQTKDFRYTIKPTGDFPVQVKGPSNSYLVDGAVITDAVCAARCGGDNKNTAFLYVGQLTKHDQKFYCNGVHCEDYGMQNEAVGRWCDCN